MSCEPIPSKFEATGINPFELGWKLNKREIGLISLVVYYNNFQGFLIRWLTLKLQNSSAKSNGFLSKWTGSKPEIFTLPRDLWWREVTSISVELIFYVIFVVDKSCGCWRERVKERCDTEGMNPYQHPAAEIKPETKNRWVTAIWRGDYSPCWAAFKFTSVTWYKKSDNINCFKGYWTTFNNHEPGKTTGDKRPHIWFSGETSLQKWALCGHDQSTVGWLQTYYACRSWWWCIWWHFLPEQLWGPPTTGKSRLHQQLQDGWLLHPCLSSCAEELCGPSTWGLPWHVFASTWHLAHYQERHLPAPVELGCLQWMPAECAVSQLC